MWVKKWTKIDIENDNSKALYTYKASLRRNNFFKKKLAKQQQFTNSTEEMDVWEK